LSGNHRNFPNADLLAIVLGRQAGQINAAGLAAVTIMKAKR
jgi:hypothetical protein